MKLLKNEQGVALVTALMLTLISLGIIMALLTMITSGAKLSGAQKRYRTAMEAAHGGTEVAMKDILPMILRNYSETNLVSQVESGFSGIGLQVATTKTCLQAKLTTPIAQWPSDCSSAMSPRQSPDMSFTLQATAGDPYKVYAKIIDTVSGNSDLSGLQLEGSGVAESSPILTPQHFPYLYRVEVQGERSSNAREQANISALYAY
ncbi:hypothetical protein KI809_15075 [Geobacter pelophilus]|uniref:Type IV pilus assembly protein PilX n=1 Tax=Geoanaerobacter pelophilus TaxID=60036 RepID=A0AAW4L7W7_9BACT|nr:pilus assembly PilX N-terminal domain-containing protein [Geoanaerobacter pelophilus]MBT0665630.1 hypothetical protein [Geoanaerobacter pelophilus]